MRETVFTEPNRNFLVLKINEPLRKGLEFTHLGLTMVVIVGLFVIAGYYGDQYFNTNNVLTVTGIIIGSIMGMGYFILEIYRLATEGIEGDSPDDSDA